MNKIIIIIVIILSISSLKAEWIEIAAKQDLFECKDSNLKNTKINFSLDGYQSESIKISDKTYTKISYPNEGEFLEFGKPDLPRFSRLIAIPDKGKPSIKILSKESMIIEDVIIYPRQNLKSDSQQSKQKFVIDNNYYSNGNNFPQNITRIGKPVIMRDYRVVNVTINPFSYNPQTKELTIYQNVEIEVETNGKAGENIKVTNRNKSKVLQNYYNSTILNYKYLDKDKDEVQQPHYLFILPSYNTDEVDEALEPLIAWKSQKGFKITSEDLSNIGSSSNALKNYIQEAYDEWDIPPDFVCLVGDADIGTYDIPTGFYGDGEGDQYFTLLEGNDILADIIIGRLSFESINQLETIVAKILYYEKEPYIDNPDWFERALLVGDTAQSGQSCITVNQYIKEIMTNYDSDFTFDEVYSGSFSSQMSSGLNEGVGYFNYRGWLGMSGFGESNIYSLNNGYMLPVTVSLTCATGNFSGSYGSISEAFLRAGTATIPKGGVAGIATATSSTHTCFNNIIDAGIFSGIFDDNIFYLGGALNRGKLALYNNYPDNPSNHVHEFSYWTNLMGDPGLEVWTSTPEELEVIHAEQISASSNYLTVKVEYNNQRLKNAWVTIVDEDNEIIASVYSDENGDALLPLQLENVNSLLLTVTKHDFIPYQSEIDIVEDDYAANISNFTIDDDNIGDSDGNDDGIINPGETIELELALQNYGSYDLESVTAELSTDNADISMIESVVDYDLIEAGEISTGSGNYVFEIDSAVLDGENIQFMLSIETANYTFTDYLEFNIAGIHLSPVDYEVYDSNGIIEPGETVELSVELSNLGSIPSEQLTAVLSSENSLITIEDQDGVFNNIEPDAEVSNNSNRFQITANAQLLPGMQIPLYMELTNAMEFSQTVNFLLEIGIVTVNSPLGPDAGGYFCYDDGDTNYEACPSYNWIEIDPDYSGDGTHLNLYDSGDEGDITNISLPINFRFYGVSYNSLTIASDGWVSPGSSTEQQSFMNWQIPGVNGPSPIIAAFWDDLDLASGNVCYYHNSGNSTFIIEWSRVRNKYNNATETFQIILYDNIEYPTSNNNSKIKIQFKDFNNVNQGEYGSYHVSHGQYATIGLENEDGTKGLQYTFNNEYPLAAKELEDETAILFEGMPVQHDEAYLVFGGTEFSDQNDNGLIDAGEEIELQVRLNNSGEQTASNINTELSSNDEYVEIISSNSAYENISPGGSQFNQQNFILAIDENSQEGHIAYLSLNISSDNEEKDIPFEIVLHAPSLEFDYALVANDDNENGILEANENADLVVHLNNLGGSPIFDINSILNTDNNYITINTENYHISNINGYTNSAAIFNVSIDSNIPEQEVIDFSLDLEAASGFNTEIAFYQITGSSMEDFESGDFSTYDWTFGGSADWQIDNIAYEGSYAAQSGDINDDESSALILEVDFSSSVDLSFWKKVSTESGWDYFYFMIDDNIQDEWSGEIGWSQESYTIPAGEHTLKWDYQKDFMVSSGSDCVWLDNIILGGLSHYAEPELLFNYQEFEYEVNSNNNITDTLEITNIGSGTVDYSIDIDPVNTFWLTLSENNGSVYTAEHDTLQININSASLDNGNYYCELIVTDDRTETIIPVTLTINQTGFSDNQLPAITKLNPNYPNPFNPQTNINFTLNTDSYVDLIIYNLKGQKVKYLADSNLEAGSHTYIWDGTNSQNKKVASGVYFYRLKTDKYSSTHKMLLLK